MAFKQLHGVGREQLPESLGAKVSAASLSIVFASDASLPITLNNDTDYGTPGADTLRTAAMLGVGSTAVSNSNPVPSGIVYTRDAAAQAIVEDTGTPGNNRPFPVKLLTTNGDASFGPGAGNSATLRVTLNSDQQTELAKQSTLDSINTNISTIEGSTTQSASDTSSILSSVSSLDNKAVQLTLNSGAAADALLTVLATRHEAAATPIAVRLSNGSTFATPAPKGRSSVALLRNDYTSVNVTTGAYVQLSASTSAEINQLDVFDSSGQTLVLAIGAAASEVDTLYIYPGGNGKVDLNIPSGSRISVKAVSANAATGELVITGLA